VDLARLPVLPQPARHVKQDGLQESRIKQRKRNNNIIISMAEDERDLKDRVTHIIQHVRPASPSPPIHNRMDQIVSDGRDFSNLLHNNYYYLVNISTSLEMF
jgi:hypothetical protein